MLTKLRPVRKTYAERLVAWCIANPLSALSLAGGIVYMIVFESYRAALAPFGITPAEIGIDHTTALWPAARVLIILAAVMFFLKSISSISVAINHIERNLAAYLIVLTALLYALSVLAEAQFIFHTANGKPYRPLLSGRLSTLAALQTSSAELEWKNKDLKSPLPTGNIVYFGSAGSLGLFYESSTGKTWRIPVSEIVVKTVFNPPPRLGRGGGTGEE